MNQQPEGPTEKQVIKEMEKMNISPSEKTKTQSLASAYEGIQLARESLGKKRRRTQFFDRMIGVIGLGAAIAAVVFLISNYGHPHDETPNNTASSTNASYQVDPINEPPSETIVTRPAEKTIVTFPEGMENEQTYQLLNEKALPFTTYIPLDWRVSTEETETTVSVTLQPHDPSFGKIDVVFFREGTTDKEAKEAFARLAVEYSDATEVERDEPLPQWVIDSFNYYQNERAGGIILGQFEETYFYMHSHYNVEAADGWIVIEKLIYDEWRWKDSGLPLKE